MDGLGYACALVLAGVFVWAGAAKLARPAQTAAGLVTLAVPGGRSVARAVPFVELAVAAILLAAPRAGAVLAVVMLAAFTAFLARAVRSGVRTPCNCFGTSRVDPVSWADVVRNMMLIASAVVTIGAARPVVPRPGAGAAAAGAVALGYLLLRTLRSRPDVG